MENNRWYDFFSVLTQFFLQFQLVAKFFLRDVSFFLRRIGKESN